jgi:flavodoxin
MANPSALIVLFSRTGTTLRVAGELQQALESRGVDCRLEELREPRSRRGIFGYFRSAIDAARDRPARLANLKQDPSRFDVVVVGTPIWGASPSTPIRTFLRVHGARCKQLAFFVTFGGSGCERTLGRLRVIAGRAPIAELAARQHDVERDRHHAALRTFAEEIARAARLASTGRSVDADRSALQ